MHTLLSAALDAAVTVAIAVIATRYLARQGRRDREAIQVKAYAKGGLETD